MCLGDIGTIRRIWMDVGIPMAEVELGEGPAAVCLMYVPDAPVGARVLVYLGFAVELLDLGFATGSLALREEASAGGTR